MLGRLGRAPRVGEEVDIYRSGDELALRDRVNGRAPRADVAVPVIGADFGPHGAVGGTPVAPHPFGEPPDGQEPAAPC